MTSLSELAVNYWNSNPVGGVRFEIRLPPRRAVDVDDSGVAVRFLVSSVSARAVLAPYKGKVLTPLRSGQAGHISELPGNHHYFQKIW